MTAPRKRKIKIACPGCGQKLDVTELPSFSRVACPSCGLSLIVPRWFNNYLLEEPEGKGGMATVYRAIDVALDREVAIKIFHPDLPARGVSPDLFLHEARIAATVNHPSVVPIYSCGECEGATYIVMQYLAGGTLERRLKGANGSLPVTDVCRWIRDVSDGLECACEHRVVHHDVKPANMLLDLESNVKISDFGLSQVIAGSAASAFTDESKMWLSPQYVSPEKVLTGVEGPEGDVYSLGASFYHLLTGTPPFRDDDVKRLVRIRTKSDPVPPDRLRPEIIPAISSLVMDMMNRDPAARPSYRQISIRIDDALRSIARSASAPAASTKARPRKVLRVSSARAGRAPRFFHPSRLPLLLILFFLMCTFCGLVFLPHFVEPRKLLDAAPALSVLYGDLPPENFPFLTESFYAEPVFDAGLAFSDYNLPLDARYAAAWTSAIYQFLDAVPSAVSSAADMGDHLRSAASLAGVQPPAAASYCLSVLSRRDPNPPNVYFSAEENVRVHLGRVVRFLYDLDPATLDEGRIPDSVLREFAALRDSFRVLPAESWLRKLFESRLQDWQSALSGSPGSATELEPVFRRMFEPREPRPAATSLSAAVQPTVPRPKSSQPAALSDPAITIHDAPFGKVSPTTPPASGE